MPTSEFEFDAMQEDAIRRAREMFSRASPSLPDFEFEKKESPFTSHFDEAIKNPPEANRNQTLFNRRSFDIFGGLFKDKDILIILAIILLLSSDGGDRLLILALIYIMS